ncbi:Uma2 family endonuclease [Kallotenue papyrolyticum]|uniref:Uma2 family endonuclease n=1 Tax=Kallotenue papyrolyticum TaxID=1325125 RepID=UPI000478649F|nr:Uma2 family endonuclease [Kallotenue papyrolyticum]
MSTTLRWTSADFAALPDDGKRDEIIDGDLYVSRQPHWHHQFVCLRLGRFLDEWNEQTKAGVVNSAPGVVFADDEDVVPDVVWISAARLAHGLDAAGYLTVAPELAVEVLSPGAGNERRDREVKLKLSSRRGVQEGWIVGWVNRQVEVYRREQAALRPVATLFAGDELRSPLLPGFALPVERLFAGM